MVPEDTVFGKRRGRGGALVDEWTGEHGLHRSRGRQAVARPGDDSGSGLVVWPISCQPSGLLLVAKVVSGVVLLRCIGLLIDSVPHHGGMNVARIGK